MVKEETTFESLKGRIEQYKAISTKWSAENVLGLPSQTTMEGPTPDGRGCIGGYQKGKKGKGKKGKGKYGKGKYGKGKSKKGQSCNDLKGKGKSKDKKGKSRPRASRTAAVEEQFAGRGGDLLGGGRGPVRHFEWKARMTFMKTKDGKWMQVKNVSNYTELGNMAFRRFGPAEDPQRTITVVAPAKMKERSESSNQMSLAGQMRSELEMRR